MPTLFSTYLQSILGTMSPKISCMYHCCQVALMFNVSFGFHCGFHGVLALFKTYLKSILRTLNLMALASTPY